MIYAVLVCAVSASFFLLIYTFIPETGGKMAKMLKRIRSINSGAGGLYAAGTDGRHAGGYLQSVTAAASRAKRAKRYNAGEGVYGLIKRTFAKIIILSDGRRDAVGKKLLRAGYSASPELFYADVILRMLAVYTLVPVFILLDVKVAAAGTIFLGIGLYYKWIGEPDERLRRIAEEITDELPRFVSVLSYSMATDRDLARAIGRYIKIAKPALRYELELLILEMRADGNAEALKRFDARVGISQLSAFISGLIDAGRGVDQKTFFYLMEENMKQIFIENRKRELARRPAKVKKAIISVGLCMFLIYLVPICLQLADGLTMFK